MPPLQAPPRGPWYWGERPPARVGVRCMARQSARRRLTCPVGWSGSCTCLPLRAAAGPAGALGLAIALTWAAVPAPAPAGVSTDSPRTGAPGMLEPHTGSLLVDYYEAFLRDHDIEAFRQHVSARYTEGTLGRLLDSTSTQARRAAVLALGVFGGYESNAAVARALRDSDPTVRSLADNALWALWFRADSPENNQALEDVRLL